MQESEVAVQQTLQIAEKKRETKCKGDRESYRKLNADFQRMARRDKRAFLNEQCKEIEEKNRKGKTRDLFKKIGDIKETFCAKVDLIKDKNGRDLTEAEDIKKRWQEYTEELYQKDLVVLKILQGRLWKYVDRELPEVQAGFRRGRGTRDQIASMCWIMEKAREVQKNFCFIDYANPLVVWTTTNYGKFLKKWECLTTLSIS